jgi:diaminopimelate decarboxylase
MVQDLSTTQLTAIADEFGTPVYIYHTEKIAAQYQKLKSAFAAQNVVILCVQSANECQHSPVR